MGALLAGATGCNRWSYDVEAVNSFLATAQPPVAGTQYTVMPPDQLTIRSSTIAEVDGQSVSVRPDGMINLPLLGELRVAGKTPLEIEQLLMEAARSYYETVDATVQISGYNSQKYYVYGQVSRSGPRPWTGNDTLLDVLTQVGLTSYAWPERVMVLRSAEPQRGGYTSEWSKIYEKKGVHPEPPDTPRYRMKVNLMAMVRHGDFANNILLQPNDVIYVQPNPYGKVALEIRRLLLPLNPIVELLTAPAEVTDATEFTD
ncbi:MAG: polysaccharide biosynthesis/export family protein [Planctomycetota bacterium]